MSVVPRLICMQIYKDKRLLGVLKCLVMAALTQDGHRHHHNQVQSPGIEYYLSFTQSTEPQEKRC